MFTAATTLRPQVARFAPLRAELSFSESVLAGTLCVALCGAVWWVLTSAPEPEQRIVGSMVLPSPGETFGELPRLLTGDPGNRAEADEESGAGAWFRGLLSENSLIVNVLVTLRRVVLGFGLAVLVGVPVGVLCGCFTRLSAFLAPLVIVGRNIPIAALIPLTFSLFGIGEFQKVMFIFIACVAFVIARFSWKLNIALLGLFTAANLLPQQALIRDAQGNASALVVDENATATLRALQVGRSVDGNWWVTPISNGPNGRGWVSASFVDAFNTSALPIVGAPPLPTPIPAPPTPTPAASPLPSEPDLVIDAVALSPSQPIPNRPFTATVTVRNAGGGATGRFAVAATWEPGAVYTSAFVEGLAGGQSVPVQLSGTLIGTGVFQVAVVTDLNNEVAELNEGNNLFNVSYRVDYPLLANQVNIQLGPNTQWDMFGGTPDFFWDGYNIAMLNGAQIGMLSGVAYENVHYDMLTPAVINNATGVGTDKVQPGVVFGMTIPEGRRAVIRVDNRSGETVWLSYRVYNDTP